MEMKWVYLLFSWVVSFAVHASDLDSLRTEKRAEGLFVIHQVEEQETLYSLARRYGGTVPGIIKYNEITDNRIEIGQIIRILIEDSPKESIKGQTPAAEIVASTHEMHEVAKGETLYSIAKKYDLKVKDLKKWNMLEGNALTLGQQLKVTEAGEARDEQVTVTENPADETNTAEIAKADPWEGFGSYLVQTGETLYTIAAKLKVKVDSLKIWNELDTDYLKIGQTLMFRGVEGDVISKVIEPNKKVRTSIDEDGFEKVFEEGVASVIESMPTSKFLALHSSLPIGTDLEVRNLMNNQVVHVRVIGKLPDTGLNKNILLRLSHPAYDQLGILDSRSRVEVSYYK